MIHIPVLPLGLFIVGVSSAVSAGYMIYDEIRAEQEKAWFEIDSGPTYVCASAYLVRDGDDYTPPCWRLVDGYWESVNLESRYRLVDGYWKSVSEETLENPDSESI